MRPARSVNRGYAVLAGTVTPIRPGITIDVPKTAAPETKEKKVRSRDRHGWSNYRRNPKKVVSIVMTSEERKEARKS